MKRLREFGIMAATPVLALQATPALAHSAKSLSLGFVGGFVHPLSGPDHLLAMISVGLWGAFLGRPLIYLLPVIFPTVMAFGGVLGMAQVPFPPVEIGIAVSVIVLGGAIMLRWSAPVWLAAIIVGIFGLFHGYAHGLELPSMANPVSFSLGFVLATGLLHVLGIVIGLLRERPGGERALRAMGGVIALAGVWYLYAALVPVA
ncbi:HupE/UreJ family protein [Novosphingobium sp.]|uniref:HupE/UreJ family protein n=1 Tax=Novosphingobium sp. TaxID=1874826 RepID=UPI003B51F429